MAHQTDGALIDTIRQSNEAQMRTTAFALAELQRRRGNDFAFDNGTFCH